MSDFDAMMAKKKAENAKNRRKRKDFDLINDSDDLIAEMINKMKVAAEVLYLNCIFILISTHASYMVISGFYVFFSFVACPY